MPKKTLKKKSVTLMNSIKEFTAKDICAIIESCNVSSVTRLKLGDLDVTFKDYRPVVEVPEASGQMQDLGIDIDDSVFKVEDEVNLKEDELSTLHLENPLEFEQGLIGDDFKDDESGSE